MSPAVYVAGLLAIGMVLLVAEVAILPGFGVAGIAAIISLAGAIALAWIKYGIIWGIGALFTSAAATLALIRIAPKTKAGRALVLNDDLQGAAAGASQALIGKTGTTVTALRPAGVAEIDGRRVDVVSDGVFIEPGSAIRVVTVDGPRVVVAPTENS